MSTSISQVEYYFMVRFLMQYLSACAEKSKKTSYMLIRHFKEENRKGGIVEAFHVCFWWSFTVPVLRKKIK